jgi:tetratricopeptide (TPR) repeat protein
MERIEELTQKAQQRQRQGRTIEAIRLFEQALECRIDVHGPESSSVKKACENLSDILNGAALKHLQNEEYEEAKKLLQKAEMLTGPDDLISAVTFNNIACYYRR